MTRRGRLMARAVWLDLALALVPALRAAGALLVWMLVASALTAFSYRAQFLAVDELGRQHLTRSLAMAGGLTVIGLASVVVWAIAHGGAVSLLAVWGVLVGVLVVQGGTLWWLRRSPRAGA